MVDSMRLELTVSLERVLPGGRLELTELLDKIVDEDAPVLPPTQVSVLYLTLCLD